MASINFTLPDNIAWGDYLLDGRSVTVSVEVKSSIAAKKDETPYIQKEAAISEPRKWNRPMPWCKRGNSCMWANCKFRHERCKHHDQWTASGCKDRPCRSLKYDPLSNKCPADGGCMYDHRDKTDLREFIYTLDFTTQDELFDAFRSRGLGVMAAEGDGIYTTSFMDKENRALLIRSLNAARDDEILHYGEDNDMITVHFIED